MLCNKQTKRNLTVLLIAMAVLASGLALTAWAKKPDKPPGGGGDPSLTGVIYFQANGVLNTMNPDGSNKTPLPLQWHLNGFGVPSRKTHGDNRWFLQLREIAGQYYPDGRNRAELFAVREDNNYIVQLTNDATLEQVPPSWSNSIAWGIDDVEVSWTGVRWEQQLIDGVPTWVAVEAGIYAASIEFNGAGDVTGLTSDPEMLVQGNALQSSYGFRCDIPSHDWSPDATKIVYNVESGEISVKDLISGSSTSIVTLGFYPQWSPDGQKILYSLGNALATANPDGTNQTTIIPPPQRVDFQRDARWSPDSTHIVYLYAIWKRSNRPGQGGAVWNVYRATANGDNLKDLTKDLGGTARPIGWR